MTVSQQVLEQLLHEDESSTLDFKRDQYPFDGADKDAKSELLKDILAFANAWRRSDAYILMGVDEVRGGRSTVVGVAKHLDDAKLQQFVISKTQRPLHFSYQEGKLDNHEIGVLCIPLQDRPIYLESDFGKLKKDTVYIRRNSSTGVADPDEIAQMGQANVDQSDSRPMLELQFSDPVTMNALGESIEVPTINLDIPEDSEIPDYGVAHSLLGFGSVGGLHSNRDYYRDVGAYAKQSMETFRVEILACNSGSVLAADVRVELLIDDGDSNLIIRDSSDSPEEPSHNSLARRIPRITSKLDVNVRRSSVGWIVTADLGKIQPKASSQTSSGLFIGAREPRDIEIKARIFADNLPAPRECSLMVTLKPTNKCFSLGELVELAKDQTG